ncbi:MAG: hypothetical protein LBM98_09375 [Oscillospiraceae bacterium]|jgi:predicted protein tyrosine phosphatase|nr:hypothetical protein [Oscillospiraceae bacterium]
MNVKVMSRLDLMRYALEKHAEKAAVISMFDRDKKAPSIAVGSENGIIEQLPLQFDDVIRGENAMQKSHAIAIAKFVDFVKYSAELLIVQCKFGQSRSAGVAAAILQNIRGGETQIFGKSEYLPNMRCYRLVNEAMTAKLKRREFRHL